MCGRYSLSSDPAKIAAHFRLAAPPSLFEHYNIAPTQRAPVIRQSADGSRRAGLLRFGLIPFWARDKSVGNRMINARAETAAQKPAYRAAMRQRRCIVPADGFYEWRKPGRGKVKQPYLILPRDQPVFALAGLWERWEPPDDEPVESFCILTTDANELMQPIHDRMPVILDPDDFDLWLDPRVNDAGALEPLLRPFDASKMQTRRVSTHVNSPANDDPRCIEPLADDGEDG